MKKVLVDDETSQWINPGTVLFWEYGSTPAIILFREDRLELYQYVQGRWLQTLDEVYFGEQDREAVEAWFNERNTS